MTLPIWPRPEQRPGFIAIILRPTAGSRLVLYLPERHYTGALADAKRDEKSLAKRLVSSRAKLDNPAFLQKAPSRVIEEQEKLVKDLSRDLLAIQETLESLAILEIPMVKD